jgi:hypothetical protein
MGIFDGLFGPPSHDEAVEREVRQHENQPNTEVVSADHTDLRPAPIQINGRVPDFVTENTRTGTRTAHEVEGHPNTHHSREQLEDLQIGTDELGMGLAVEPVEEPAFDDDSFRF